MKLLWLSDKITGYSSYSKITREMLTRLAKSGVSVAHIPMGRANRMCDYVDKGVLLYTSGYDPWGEDVALEHYINFRADMLVTLKEPWVFNTIHKRAINFVPWAIIDHSPVSPSITSRLKTAFRVLAPTRFAQRELRRADITAPVHYCPHGVDTKIFRPLPEHKEQCQKLWYLDPDEFNVLIVAMNRVRKMIPQMLRGYKRFLDLNPDVKSSLFLWTDMRPPRGEAYEGAVGMGVSDVGVNLLPEIIELELYERVKWPDSSIIRKGIPDWAGEDWAGGWDMVKLYNAASVLLLCSGGEGFGLPLIEAQSCGIPVITTDYAGGPERWPRL